MTEGVGRVSRRRNPTYDPLFDARVGLRYANPTYESTEFLILLLSSSTFVIEDPGSLVLHL